MTTIAFIGGGSLRTLGVIRDWALAGDVAKDSRLVVMDLDPRRTKIISSLAAEMPEVQEMGINVTGTTDLGEALEGPDFVYNVIRVGGVDRMEYDKRIALNYGFHSHDDFGPSAAMIVLRTVPVMLKIAAEMEKRCPDAWLVNFTNPVPFIVRAVKEYSKVKVMGYCGGDRHQLHGIPATLGWDPVPYPGLAYRGCGIDHFSWSTELTLNGEDVYPRVHEEIAKVDHGSLSAYDRMGVEVFQLYGQWLSAWAHCFHWTHHDEMVEIAKEHYYKLDTGLVTSRNNAQELAIDEAEKCIGRNLGPAYWEQPALKKLPSHPSFPAVGITAISSMLRDAGEEIKVNMHAPGAIDNLQDEGIVLLTARLFRDGPKPFHFAGVPEGIAPLTRQILDYQTALIRTAVEGNRRDLETTLLMDPIVRDVGKVRRMLDELLEANRGKIRSELSES